MLQAPEAYLGGFKHMGLHQKLFPGIDDAGKRDAKPQDFFLAHLGFL